MRPFLLYTLILSTITIRIFTEILGVLPRYFNLIDLPILCLALAILLFYRFGLLGVANIDVRYGYRSLLYIMLAFTFVWFAAYFLNAHRVHLKPAASFLLMNIEPVLFAWIFLNLDFDKRDIRGAYRLLWLLGITQLFVAIPVQLPLYLAGASPDVVSGTFGFNNSQMCFFLVLLSGIVLGKWIYCNNNVYLLIMMPLVLVFYAAGFKAMWLSYPLTIFLFLIAAKKIRVRWSQIMGFAVLIIVGSLLLQQFVFSAKLSQSRFTKYVLSNPMIFFETGKWQATVNIFRIYAENPLYALVGVGPGTYSSRAFRTFAPGLGDIRRRTNVTLGLVEAGCMTDIARRYTLPLVLKRNPIGGSATFDGPFIQYASTLVEVGLIGGWLIFIGIYYRVFKRVISILRSEADELGYILSGAAFMGMIFLFQMAIWDNWFEVVRVTIPLWIVVFMLFRWEELNGRQVQI